MNSVCKFLTLDLFAPKLLFCLCSAEKVGGKLCTPHVIQNVLTLFQSFPLLNVLGTQTAVKSLIDRNSYSYYIDENTGELFAVNNAGGTSPDLKMDETSGDIYYLI